MRMEKEETRCHGVYEPLVQCSRGTAAPKGLQRLVWHVGRNGWLRTFRKALNRIMTRLNLTSYRPSDRLAPQEEVLNLQPGEWVEVRSKEEIDQMLDSSGNYMGLFWMPNMDRFCGKRFRVLKRMERMLLESTGETRKIKNTVLLEGAICEDLFGCDRSCFHFWREAWLKRVDGEES
jgi:hypothetical protein